MKEIVFVIGGCRSGKSRYALETTGKFSGKEKVFIATCVPRDDEMKERVKNHRNERSEEWRTVEAPLELPRAIRENSRQDCIILADCLTLWVSNLILGDETLDGMKNRCADLVAALSDANCPVVLVSNEVGMGIVPENKLARRFRDAAGFVNQVVAAHADRVILSVAGIALQIKGPLSGPHTGPDNVGVARGEISNPCSKD